MTALVPLHSLVGLGSRVTLRHGWSGPDHTAQIPKQQGFGKLSAVELGPFAVPAGSRGIRTMLGPLEKLSGLGREARDTNSIRHSVGGSPQGLAWGPGGHSSPMLAVDIGSKARGSVG